VPGSPMPSVLTDSGVVVGTTRIDGVDRLFRWRDGRAELLLPQDTDRTSLVDANEQGQVLAVNRYWDGGWAIDQVILWQPDGTVVPLGPRGEWWSVNGINDHGVVVGVHAVATREAAYLA